MWKRPGRLPLLLALLGIGSGCALAAKTPRGVEALIAQIQDVGTGGEGHADAAEAVRELSAKAPEALPEILAGMDGQTPLVRNWLSCAFEAAAERALAQGNKLPAERLESFVLDRQHEPQARALAYEWLSRVDGAAPGRLVPGFINDPATELRRLAVEQELDAAEKLAAADAEAGHARLRQVFDAARDPDQVERAAKKLESLGDKPDLSAHYGVLRAWRVIGPFDNTAKVGFDAAYPPEASTALDLGAEQQGKSGKPLRWIEHTSTDALGQVDLNRLIGKEKGVVAYALANVESPLSRRAQVRASSPNAVKIWVNGRLVFRRDEYHHGTEIDQHLAPVSLERGLNQVLIKVCQNEQTDDWAQDWAFQLRVCDDTGGGIF
jgi:hypothetical protein